MVQKFDFPEKGLTSCWYHVEYAKSNRSTCKEFRCKRKIEKGELRIGLKQDGETDHQGEDQGWYCFQDSYGACLWKTFTYKKAACPTIKNANMVTGLESLGPEDRQKVSDLIAGITRSGGGKGAAKGSGKPAAGAKRKAAGEAKEAPEPKRKAAAKDKAAKGPPARIVEEMWNLSSDKLKALLKANDMNTSGTKAQLVSRCADAKAFGALPRCPKCSGGRIRYEGGVYKCPGFMDDEDFMACTFSASTIKRNAWKDA